MKSVGRWLLVCVLLSAPALVPLPARAGGGILVDENEDEDNSDDDCSLREAVRAANTDTPVDECAAGSGADRIFLPAGSFLLDEGPLDLFTDVLIVGAGRAQTIIKRDPEAGPQRIINSSAPDAVALVDLTIANGSENLGGGINHASAGQLVLQRVIIRGNRASEGAGIWSEGSLSIADSVLKNNDTTGNGGGIYTDDLTQLTETTLSGNDADLSGGGLYLLPGSTSIVTNSTLSGNSGTSRGGGIFNSGTLSLENATLTGNTVNSPEGFFSNGGGLSNQGTALLSNVTITKNRAKNEASGVLSEGVNTISIRNSIISGNPRIDGDEPQNNCLLSGDSTSDAFNLEQGTTCNFTAKFDLPPLNPRLGPLRNNGGLTRTHALRPSSPALDAGSPGTPTDPEGTCKSTDQRGVTRPQDGPDDDSAARCDVGAFELRMIKHRRDLSFDLDRHLKADGRVSVVDDFSGCRKGARVLVQRKTPNGWKTVANPRATRRGRYSTGLPDREGRYRAITKKRNVVRGDVHICLAAASSSKRHRH